MKTYQGGEKVKSGFYFSFREKDLQDIPDQGVLPGNHEDHYVKVPGLFVILGGPIIGLLYIMFLPFIAFAMVLSVAAKAFWAGTRSVALQLEHVATANWRPGFAFFAWWKHSTKKETLTETGDSNESDTPPVDALSELEKDIEERRKEGQK